MSVSAQQTKPKPLKSLVSLDMCADQYVLGLARKDQIMALSKRASLGESYFADRAKGVSKVSAKLENILILKPDAVVRTYGGDPRLITALKAHGIEVIDIHEVNTLDQGKSEMFRIAHLIDADAGALIEARQFNRTLASIPNRGKGRTALYYTPTGFTAGADTMIGDMIRKLGFSLESQSLGWNYISPEVILSIDPDVYILGFFDDKQQYRRSAGRHPVVRAKIDSKGSLTFPTRAIACNGWFNVYDLAVMGGA